MAPFWSKEAKDVASGVEKEISPASQNDAERQGSLVEAADAKYTAQGLQRKLKARHVQV